MKPELSDPIVNFPPGIITISDGQGFTLVAKAGEMMSENAIPVTNISIKKKFLNKVVFTINKQKLKF
ncbi:hypothetical protein NSMS1_55190 [Nostoc sp. MS1]|nr:hypothetical protein NSMS1_55190 [Nostoc sp. MS1]